MSDLFLSTEVQTNQILPTLDREQITPDLSVRPLDRGAADDFLNIQNKAKEILGQVDWVITHRKIDYLQKLMVLRSHKSVAVRRKVAQGVGFLATKQDVEEIQKWQLAESDRETWLILQSTIDKIQRGVAGDNLEKSVKILSVSEALLMIKKLIGEGEYILEGELAEVNLNKQMYYFGLKDNQEGRLECWAFAGVIVRSGFPLNEGLSVRVHGKFKLSSKSSRLYFDVQKVVLTGEGELLRNLKLLEEKLTREGLFSIERKRKIPKLPKNILLLASTNSAAFTDFTKVLGERRGGINIYYLPIKTQGVGAEYELLDKLGMANELTEKYAIDTVVLTRGGGSKEDLIVFNSEKVVRAVHGINRPTIVAIGHERDFSLVEMTADLRASTPTNAAQFVSASRSEILSQMDTFGHFLIRYFLERKQQYILTTNRLLQISKELIHREIAESKRITQQAGNLVTSVIGQTILATQRLWQSVFITTKNRVNMVLVKLGGFQNIEISTTFRVHEVKRQVSDVVYKVEDISKQNLQTFRREFELVSSQLFLHDPKNILQKGYAIVRQSGEIVERKMSLKKNSLNIEFQDGEVEVG